MLKRARHTIINGRVVEFALGFRYAGPGLGCDRYDATGPFVVSASRNAVVVHRAECETAGDTLALVAALGFAQAEHEALARCGGRPSDDLDDGKPRAVEYAAGPEQLSKGVEISIDARGADPAAPAWKLTKVNQRDKNDCERCCYAMMLGLPYERVPYFYEIFKTTRRDERQKWLRENFGLNFISVTAGVGSSPCVLPDAFCIAGVASPTGHEDGHAVFGRIRFGAFELIHDPHPERERSGKVPFDLTFFVPVALFDSEEPK